MQKRALRREHPASYAAVQVARIKRTGAEPAGMPAKRAAVPVPPARIRGERVVTDDRF